VDDETSFCQELREAVRSELAGALETLSALVAQPSLRGQEVGAQECVEVALRDLGFAVERQALNDELGNDPLAGVPFQSYDGRFNVLGHTPRVDGPTLLINGHIDVVPVDERTWSTPPFSPFVKDGWLYGRGAGDMKGGFAMAFLALRALRAVGSKAGTTNLSFLSVIEEEYTGNGTLAAVRAGVEADAVILPEPTNLDLLLGGVAITWLRVQVYFGGGHAESADRLASPAQVVARLIDAFAVFEDRYNEVRPAPYHGIARPFNVNVGVLRLGEWASSVPAVLELDVRVGHLSSKSDEHVRADVHALVAATLVDAGGPAFDVTFNGFKAEGYYLDAEHSLVGALQLAHQRMHGVTPGVDVLGSTTDARYYVNQLGVPALCFGPVVKNMHGSNECVNVASIEQGALTLARFVAAYFDKDRA
jgi:acetylornithine deacetylase